MALMNLKPVMKEKVMDGDESYNKKPGLLKKKFGAKPSKSTEVSPGKGLLARLSGK